MKKALIACAALVCSSVFAAGPYDGVYVNQNDSSHFLSVHQNQSTLLVTSLRVLPSTNVALVTPQGSFVPPINRPWDLLAGVITGPNAVIEGVTVYGACAQQLSISFNGASAVSTLMQIAQTSAGAAQGFPCLGAIGAQQVFQRIF